MTTVALPLPALRFAFALARCLPASWVGRSWFARKQFGMLVLCMLLQMGVMVHAAAVELAQIRVLSHIGQPLQAEVELSGVGNGEVLQVKQAWPDTYRLANIQRNPVLNQLRVQLQTQGNWQGQGQGQKYTVSLQTGQAIIDPYLHIFLEIADSKEQHVRALTIWLEPDPQQPIAEAVLHEASEQRKRLAAHPDGELALDTPALAAANRAQVTSAPSPIVTESATKLAKPMAAEHSSSLTAKRPPSANPPAGCAAAARKQAEHCQLVAEANIRLDGQLEMLEQKVDILKRVVLADDGSTTAAPQANLASLAEPPPIATKKKPPKPSFPWTILLISAAVFVAVAVLVFGVLMLRSRYRAKRKPSGTPANPALAPASAAAPASDDAEAAPESTTASAAAPLPAGSGKRARLAAWFAAKRAALRRSLQTVASKLTWPGRRLKTWLNDLRSKRQAKKAASNPPAEGGDVAAGSS